MAANQEASAASDVNDEGLLDQTGGGCAESDLRDVLQQVAEMQVRHPKCTRTGTHQCIQPTSCLHCWLTACPACLAGRRGRVLRIQAEIARQQEALGEVTPAGLKEELSALKDEAWRLDLFSQLERMKEDVLNSSTTPAEEPGAVTSTAAADAAPKSDAAACDTSQREAVQSSHAAPSLSAQSLAEQQGGSEANASNADSACTSDQAVSSTCGQAPSTAHETAADHLLGMLKAEQEEASDMLADMLLKVEARSVLNPSVVAVAGEQCSTHMASSVRVCTGAAHIKTSLSRTCALPLTLDVRARKQCAVMSVPD